VYTKINPVKKKR